MHMSIYKILSKFVAKMIKYMLLFKDILTFLVIDYRDASLITLYLVAIKNQMNRIILTFKKFFSKK